MVIKLNLGFMKLLVLIFSSLFIVNSNYLYSSSVLMAHVLLMFLVTFKIAVPKYITPSTYVGGAVVSTPYISCLCVNNNYHYSGSTYPIMVSAFHVSKYEFVSSLVSGVGLTAMVGLPSIYILLLHSMNSFKISGSPRL